MYWWGLSLMCLMIGISVSAAAQQVLFDFEKEEHVKEAVRNEVQIQRVPAGGKLSGQALQVEFQPAEWPNIMFRPTQAWNWTGAGALAIDIYNPNHEPVWFGIRVDDDPRAGRPRPMCFPSPLTRWTTA